MTDYFRCVACGRVVVCRYNAWPTCPCHTGAYSHYVGNDFDKVTEEEYDEWVDDNE